MSTSWPRSGLRSGLPYDCVRNAELVVVLISVAIVIATRILTLQMGPKVMLAAKVKMRSGLTIDEAVAHLNVLERRIKEAWPEVGWCFVEPDVTD